MTDLLPVTKVTETETLKACPLCDEPDFVDFVTDVRPDRPTTNWKLCESCGHVFVSPQPTQKWLDGYYLEGYRRDVYGMEKEDPEEIPQNSVAEETQRAIRISGTILRSIANVSRHLDIGSSTGVALAAVVDRMGPEESVGVEPNDAWRTFAINAFEQRIPQGDPGIETNVKFYTNISEVPKSPKFDLITALHVLEHVADPIAMLRGIKKLLKKGGVLIVETPVLYGGMASPLMWPHIHCFTQDTVRSLLEKGGFYVAAIETSESMAPLWASPQHMTVIAWPKPVSTDLRTVLSRFNLYRSHVGFVQTQAANSRAQYEMG